MRREWLDPRQPKGRWVGPLTAALTVAVDRATIGIDAPHRHERRTEIAPVDSGTATTRVARETIALAAGDPPVVEPGEPRTFSDSSADYRHFVIHTPAPAPDGARADHRAVPRERLGSSRPAPATARRIIAAPRARSGSR